MAYSSMAEQRPVKTSVKSSNLFMPAMNSKQQGDIGVAHAIYFYTLQGFTVSIPNTDNSKYDLIVDKNDGALYRVQVKTTWYIDKKSNKYVAELRTCGGNRSGIGKYSYITSKDADLLWISTKEEDGYEIPVDLIEGRSHIQLGPKYEGYKI